MSARSSPQPTAFRLPIILTSRLMALRRRHDLSLRQANHVMHRAAIAQAYHFAVQLAQKNEVRAVLGLDDSQFKSPPTTEALKGTAIRRLSYEPGGAMRLELDARSGRDGGVIVYLPLMLNGRVERWTCVTPDYPDIASFLPACRYMDQGLQAVSSPSSACSRDDFVSSERNLCL